MKNKDLTHTWNSELLDEINWSICKKCGLIKSKFEQEIIGKNIFVKLNGQSVGDVKKLKTNETVCYYIVRLNATPPVLKIGEDLLLSCDEMIIKNILE